MARTRKATKFYFNADGIEQHSAQPDSIGFGFHLFDPSGAKGEDDKPLVIETIRRKAADYPAVIQNCAMLMGFLQKIGDSYSGTDVDASEAVATMDERLMDSEWIMGGKGGLGPQPSMLLDAVMSVLVQSGVEDTPEKRAEVKKAIATPEQKKAALNTPNIKAAYEQLKAAKAAEKAAKAAEAANAADPAESGFLSGLGG